MLEKKNKILGLGRQEFALFKRENLIYVDKTKEIYKLINTGKYYFFSRPRRFGKSLLLNTLKELFKGKKDLFEDTWIYNNWDWNKQNPIIKISLAGIGYGSIGIIKALDNTLEEIAFKNSIKLTEDSFDTKFRELIKKMGSKTPVVILIDEYDKPIIDYLEQRTMDIALKNREVLKRFYSVIKDSDNYIKLLFITGVSKFSRVSFFSELNNLEDITISKNHATIVGYTQDEILKYYYPYLERIQDEFNITQERLFEVMKLWYDGYSWDAKNFVYNPYSILSFLSARDFKNYWFKTGTPTFLTKMIKERDINIEEYESLINVDDNLFDSYEIDNINLNILLFQAGYLTIKERIVNSKDFSVSYNIGYPNKEVKDSFNEYLILEFLGTKDLSMRQITKKLHNYLENKDLDSFFEDLHTLFAKIPSPIFIAERESYYHSIIYLLFKIMGVHKIEAERMTNKGRIDTVIKTHKYIYVMEFKMEDAKSGIKQIKKLKYYEPYLNDKREIIIVAVSFSKKDRNIKEFIVKSIEDMENI